MIEFLFVFVIISLQVIFAGTGLALIIALLYGEFKLTDRKEN